MMTRPWLMTASPVALAAGLFLAHCSSSSTSGTTGSSSSSKQTQGSSSSSATNESSSSSTKTSSSSSVTGTSSTSGGGSSSGSSAGDAGESAADIAAAAAAHAGDEGAACVPPTGGNTCNPGTLSCGGSPCAVPANECCDPSGGTAPESCVAPGTACAGTVITCNEAADCATGEVCCIASNNTTSGTVSCQKLTGGECPVAQVARQQICRSNAECASGKCQFWNCLGNVIEACGNPVPSLAVCMVSSSDGGTP